METLTPGVIFQALAVLIVLWKGFEEIGKMIDRITSRHDREKSWDKAVESISEERQKIVKLYDGRLDDIEKKIDANHDELETKLDTNYNEYEAKIQEIRAEQMFMMELFRAVLDGLGQLNCNGAVTNMKNKLDDYLNHQAHDI